MVDGPSGALLAEVVCSLDDEYIHMIHLTSAIPAQYVWRNSQTLKLKPKLSNGYSLPPGCKSSSWANKVKKGRRIRDLNT